MRGGGRGGRSEGSGGGCRGQRLPDLREYAGFGVNREGIGASDAHKTPSAPRHPVDSANCRRLRKDYGAEVGPRRERRSHRPLIALDADGRHAAALSSTSTKRATTLVAESGCCIRQEGPAGDRRAVPGLLGRRAMVAPSSGPKPGPPHPLSRRVRPCPQGEYRSPRLCYSVSQGFASRGYECPY